MQTRDIEVKIVNSYAPCSAAVRRFVGKYWLINYRGPIEDITVQLDGMTMCVKIGFGVVDNLDGANKQLIFEYRTPQMVLEQCEDVGRYFEDRLRHTIEWITLHELKECFLRRLPGHGTPSIEPPKSVLNPEFPYHWEFVTNPHPEVEGYANCLEKKQTNEGQSANREHEQKEIGHGAAKKVSVET